MLFRLIKPRKSLNIVLAVLMLHLVVAPLEAQGLKLLDKSDRKSLLDGGLGSGSIQRSRPGQRGEGSVPLEGRIDRRTYCLGPGDEVDISIWGGEFYESYQLVVSAGGRLLVPPAGPLEVAGMTLAGAEKYLIERMNEYYSDCRASLTLINPRTFRVFAAGALARTGTYYMSAVDRVSELIEAAGGVRAGGSLRAIRLTESDNRLIETADMLRYRMAGDLAGNPRLVDGCIVEVPPVENYVLLRGKFTNLSGSDSVAVAEQQHENIAEFVVEFLPGETLSNVLHLVGGPQDIETVGEGRRVFESGGKGAPARWVALTDEMLAGFPENGAVYEFPVRNMWVFVTGSVNLAGRYVYQPGWTVRDYLGQAGGPNMEGTGKKCYIKRGDGSRVKCKFTDSVQPGDVLYVPHRFKFYEWSPVVTLITALIFLFK
ncbi:MAG: SLBB domain-containing protein [Gemmatimonadota bacterium]|nr:SLBB domain-containing protein [Gemmatimonadota bacterium]